MTSRAFAFLYPWSYGTYVLLLCRHNSWVWDCRFCLTGQIRILRFCVFICINTICVPNSKGMVLFLNLTFFFFFAKLFYWIWQMARWYIFNKREFVSTKFYTICQWLIALPLPCRVSRTYCKDTFAHWYPCNTEHWCVVLLLARFLLCSWSVPSMTYSCGTQFSYWV